MHDGAGRQRGHESAVGPPPQHAPLLATLSPLPLLRSAL